MLNYNPLLGVWARTAEALMKPPRGITLPWWPQFSDLLGGLRLHELTLLCAPTGAGKTQLLANISAQLLIQNEPHFVAPVETGDTDFLARVFSAFEQRDLNDGNPVNPDYLVKMQQRYARFFETGKLWVSTYDNRVAIEEMVATLKYMHQEYGVTVAVLDNLNFFLKVTRSSETLVEMDTAVHELVMLVKQIPIHIILVVHPKKTDGGRVLSEFDIKGSSTAVQECANVCLFNRPSEKSAEEGKRVTDRELVFRKIRKRGVGVGRPLWFSFQGGRYEELK